MALTKVGKEGVTGISNSSNATAITIDSSERVGIGTTTIPTADSMVTVRKDGSANEFNILSGTSHASVINMGDADDYNIQRIKADNSSNSLQFQTNNAERMRISSAGSTFFNCTSAPSASVVGSGFIKSDYDSELFMSGSLTTGNDLIHFFNPNGKVGSIATNGSATAYNTSSDARLKENVTYDWDATTRLKQLKPARFNFISEADTTVDGFLAHEVSSIVPEAITGTKDATKTETYIVTPAVIDSDGNETTPAVKGTRTVPDYQAIDQSKLVPLLCKTILELEARITALETA